jgi:hypothetical protein
MSFTIPGRSKHSDSTLEWSYAQQKNSTTGGRFNFIVLRYIGNTGNGDRDKKKHTDNSSKILAQLIRSKDTRYPGSLRCASGNGGMLVIDRDADRYIGEYLIVATCMVMLQREIDRRSMMQIAVIAGAAGGAPLVRPIYRYGMGKC